MLAGLIRDDERKVLDGIPGLSDLPVIGRLFAHSRMETNQTDIILTLTPHIIRVLDLDESDLVAFRVGRDSGSTPGIQLLPAVAEPTRAPQPDAAPGTPGAAPVQRPVLPGSGAPQPGGQAVPPTPVPDTPASGQPRH